MSSLLPCSVLPDDVIMSRQRGHCHDLMQAPGINERTVIFPRDIDVHDAKFTGLFELVVVSVMK